MEYGSPVGRRKKANATGRTGGMEGEGIPQCLYKERTKRWHDKRIKIKSFKAGDKVLLFNSRIRLFGHSKLRSKWEGPFKVLEAADHGAVTLQDDDRKVFKANGQCLKIFLEPEMPTLEEVDVFELHEVV